MTAHPVSFARAIRAEFQAGHLSLVGLARGDRLLALAALAVIAAAGVVIVLVAFGEEALGPSVGVVGRYVETGIRGPLSVPVIVIPLASLGLALGEACVAAAALRPGGAKARRTVLGLAVTNLTLGGIAATTRGAVDVAISAVPAGNALVSTLWGLTALIGLASPVALVAVVVLRPRAGRWLAPVAAAAPWVVAFLALVAASGQAASMSPLQQALFPDFPPVFTVIASLLAPLLYVVGLTSALLFVLSVWQASTWSRATARFVGTRTASGSLRYGWLLPLLLGAKVLWLLLGFAGLLPPALGGASSAWERVRSDDAISWVYSGVLTLAIAAWLLHRRRGAVREGRALAHAGRVVVAVGVIYFLVAILPMLAFAAEGLLPSGTPVPAPDDPTLAACLSAAPSVPISTSLLCIGLWLTSWQAAWILGVVIVALAAGVVLALRRRGDESWLFLVIFGVWALPRMITATRSTPPAEVPAAASLPAFNAPQPETMDIAITLVVLVLAGLWWIRTQTTVGPWVLAVVLVVSTMTVHAATLVPTATVALFAALAVVFPVVYELAFDSEGLNERLPGRGGRVLADLGVRAVALVLLASTLAVGVSTATSTTAQLGFLLFGVPFIATITAAAVSLHVSSRGSPTDAPPPPDPAPRPRQALGGLVVGAALVAAAAVVATVLEPQTRALYPTPAERVAVLETRITAATNAVVAISQEPDDTSGARIDGLWQAERDWLRDNPAPDCAGSAWARWQDTLDDVREVGLIVTAALTVDAGTPTELAQLQAKLEALPPQAAAHEQATAEALAEAREACAG